jgi:hypothetical protein
MGVFSARLDCVPGQPCPPALSTIDTVGAPPGVAACVVVV